MKRNSVDVELACIQYETFSNKHLNAYGQEL